jgi:hypothetical protein
MRTLVTAQQLGKAMYRFALTLSLILLMAVSGCVNRKTVSNKAPTYVEEAKRIFLINNIEYGNRAFRESFEQKMQVAAKQCNADLQAVKPTSLDLDTKAMTSKMKAFNPDVVLTVQLTHHVYGSRGETLRLEFNSRLVLPATNETVWRAQTTVLGGRGKFDEQAEGLATQVIGKLTEDRILHSCKAA